MHLPEGFWEPWPEPDWNVMSIGCRQDSPLCPGNFARRDGVAHLSYRWHVLRDRWKHVETRRCFAAGPITQRKEEERLAVAALSSTDVRQAWPDTLVTGPFANLQTCLTL